MSQQKKKLVIGLFGFGVVGEGLYRVLQQTPTLDATIKSVCIKHPDKPRNAPHSLFTTDAEALLNDPEINVIVELIDDADAAIRIARSALSSRKALVSASKKMIARHLPELLELQRRYETPFLYEAACCASIPVIRNLEEYYDNDLLRSVQGIVNGSTNYILTRIAEDNLSFGAALQLAQEKGFAESDPSLDIEGKDAVFKLAILLGHAYGIVHEPERITHAGITGIKEGDAVFAREKGFKIKLIAQASKLKNGKVAAFVLPRFVHHDSNLYLVSNEYNGIEIGSGLADKQFFCGKGAGSFPTASAVLSDLSALRYDYRYEYKKLLANESDRLSNDFYLHVYVSFRKLHQVPHHLFARIDEWSSNQHGCSVSGLIHFSRLEHDWWKQDFVSLITYPDAVVDREDFEASGSLEPLQAEWREASVH
ncbi:homoserine dehydrogenase [Rurimicrobium arvi]|uniref:Homoserine dehydrogenase n=1 Tax=Rurimicrobium arvi TaxID=2049916 RepID=A0ABP8MUC9_9BACT